ncbi:MAG: hypothetical protein LBF81_00075, partial [Prevotellaceae bacterium]|nr:hypothetical protein [Prevotellaceae bacterium]
YKTIFGGHLDARTIENQETEINLKSWSLNKFMGIGMPDATMSVNITAMNEKNYNGYTCVATKPL